MNKSKATVLG